VNRQARKILVAALFVSTLLIAPAAARANTDLHMTHGGGDTPFGGRGEFNTYGTADKLLVFMNNRFTNRDSAMRDTSPAASGLGGDTGQILDTGADFKGVVDILSATRTLQVFFLDGVPLHDALISPPLLSAPVAPLYFGSSGDGGGGGGGGGGTNPPPPIFTPGEPPVDPPPGDHPSDPPPTSTVPEPGTAVTLPLALLLTAIRRAKPRK
jgi:hypothetical protein